MQVQIQVLLTGEAGGTAATKVLRPNTRSNIEVAKPQMFNKKTQMFNKKTEKVLEFLKTYRLDIRKGMWQ